MRLFPNAKRVKTNLLNEYKGKKILDVGCGQNKTPQAIGIDRRQSKGVSSTSQADIDHDLTKFPWPIADNSFDLVICQHVIEHLPDTVKTMEEMNRVTKPGGKIFIETPHYTWFEAYRHYEHCHKFSFGAFDYFLKGNRHYKTDFRFADRYIFFDDLTNALGIGFLANAFPRVYEKRFAFIFPATSFHITFKVDK
jgi:2-polyprenyl-3-methyl-5-hydroxy-6-metoxy-1,4-benzoquinol methylase